MAASARLLATWLSLMSALVTLTYASPLFSVPSAPWQSLKRGEPVEEKYPNGTIAFLNPSNGQPVAQGLASDGSGVDFSATAIIWIVYSFIVGVPLAFAGTRLWRFNSGAGLGIFATVCFWAAFINTESAHTLSDRVVTIIPVCAFVLAFTFGLFNFGRFAGVMLLALMGGFSVGVRIVLFRPGLLVPVSHNWGNWLIAAAFGVLGLLVLIDKRIEDYLVSRASIGRSLAVSGAAAGTFLTALGVDLVVNKQAGMGRGLRFLFDHNKAHYQDLIAGGWHPPISTIIILAVSLGLTPVLAFAQHRFAPPLEADAEDNAPAPRLRYPPRVVIHAPLVHDKYEKDEKDWAGTPDVHSLRSPMGSQSALSAL
ncbi:hypothetical protein B0H21DRAFT_232552 [Amylocystis lapponica]|nr:hypothetical protein B0H21DRAFT_232552 [Amylocystis lapponica]